MAHRTQSYAGIANGHSSVPPKPTKVPQNSPVPSNSAVSDTCFIEQLIVFEKSYNNVVFKALQKALPAL